MTDPPITSLAGWLVILLLCMTGSSKAFTPPNIVIILADDLGWNDVSFHGSNQIPTPNLDALAYDGIMFDNYYVQPICSPSRAALLTGRYPIHLGLQHGVVNACRRYGLGLNETILPQYLKELGYATHGLGKWHLGFYTEDYIPSNRGFDSYFGMYAGTGDYWTHSYALTGFGDKGYGLDLHHNNDLVKDKFGVYGTNMFTESGVDIINNHNTSKPLFLYFAEQAVHAAGHFRPLEAPYEYIKPFENSIQSKKRRTYAGMVSALDESVGNLTKALHSRGMLNNTIIVFSTDNGGPVTGNNGANNMPLRGEKWTLWEGGVRGTSFVWSPALKNTPRVSHQLMHISDWLPTLLNAAGYNMSQLADKPLDGVDQWATLVGDVPTKRREVLLNIDPVGWASALKLGDYKVHFHGSNGWGKWFPLPGVKNMKWLGVKDAGPEQQWQAARHNRLSDKAIEKRVLESDVHKALLEIGRKPVKVSPLVIQCGPKPANASTNCDVNKAPCLYDLYHDPCEYNNIAAHRPDILRATMDRLNAYNISMVPMKNKPIDPKGLPGNNGYWAYLPWVKAER